MDTATTTTPNWMVGLLIIFSLALAAVFGLYLYRHAQRAALEEQHASLVTMVVPLRLQAAAHEDAQGPLDKQIAARRALLQPIEVYESTNRADVDRALVNNSATLKANEGLQDKAMKSYADVMKSAPESRLELGREEERAFDTERQSDERRRQLREDVEKQSQALEGQKKKWRIEKAALDARIEELRGRTLQLTNQLDVSNREFKADGSIMESRARDGFVVIDRGFEQQLRSGTRFTVFTKRGGKIVTKGQIQVTEVRARTATALVLEELDGNDPLIPGDLLHNPVYDPDHQRSFAIRGDFRRFSRSEIKRFIEESGGTVQSDLSINVDYLVAGDNAKAELDQATKLGVGILSEDQVLDVLHYDQRPSSATWDYIFAQCKAGGRFGFAGRFTAVDEATARGVITRNGGRVSSGVAAGYAGLVVGDDATAEIAEALRLNVPVIPQSQFARVVDPGK